MMDHWGRDGFQPPFHGGPGIWGPLSMVLLVLVLGLLAFAVLRMTRSSHSSPTPDSAQTILRERFARGELDEATFRQHMAALSQSSAGQS